MQQKNLFFLIIMISAITVIAGGCKEESDPITPPAEHFEPEGLMIQNALFDTLVYYFQGVLRSGDTLKAPAGNNLSPHWRIRFLGSNAQVIAAPTDGSHSLGWVIANQNIAELYRDPGDEWEFHLRGKEEGLTTLVLRVLHGDHSDFQTRPIPVLVDSSIHGEAAGLMIIEEDSGDTLVTVGPGGTISGSLSVQQGVTTDHMVVYFLDDEGVQFQPAVPPHSLGYTVGNTAVVTMIPPEEDEPWSFQLNGVSAGNTTLILKLLSGDEEEYVSLPIPVTVAP